MQAHERAREAQTLLAGAGGELVAGSEFEIEQPETDFADEVTTVDLADSRED